MNFGDAIASMKSGKKVARAGWNGKGMFIYLVNGTEINGELLHGPARKHLYETLTGPSDETRVKIRSHIDMKAADGALTIGWNPSQVDMLSEDWMIVES